MPRRPFHMPIFVLHRSAPVPLYQQIAEQIRQAIRHGEIRPGAWLPSTRKLAKLVGVSRNTVLVAYETLAAEEWLCGKPGAGMRVHTGSFAGQTAANKAASILRAAQYPAHTVWLTDPDGNPIRLQR